MTDGHKLRHHYNEKHAAFNEEITSYTEHTCNECGLKFANAYSKLTHECRVLNSLPQEGLVDSKGWLPHNPPTVDPIPDTWNLYTDGSGGEGEGTRAGWGVAVFGTQTEGEALVKLHGPVMLDRTDQRLFNGSG